MKWNCFFAASAETIRKTITCQTFFPKYIKFFIKPGKQKKSTLQAGHWTATQRKKGLREAPLFSGIFLFLKGHFLQDTLSGAEPAQKPRFSPAALLYFLKELFPGIRIETAQDSGCG